MRESTVRCSTDGESRSPETVARRTDCHAAACGEKIRRDLLTRASGVRVPQGPPPNLTPRAGFTRCLPLGELRNPRKEKPQESKRALRFGTEPHTSPKTRDLRIGKAAPTVFPHPPPSFADVRDLGQYLVLLALEISPSFVVARCCSPVKGWLQRWWIHESSGGE